MSIYDILGHGYRYISSTGMYEVDYIEQGTRIACTATVTRDDFLELIHALGRLYDQGATARQDASVGLVGVEGAGVVFGGT